MPELVSTPASLLTASAMYAAGSSSREVAKVLGVSPATAWRMKHQDILDPVLVQHASKTITDKMLLASTGAIDDLLERAVSGGFKEEKAVDLAKIASICLQSAGAYAAASGQGNTLGQLAAEFGIGSSHSVSRVTLEQKVTVESASTHASIAVLGEK